MLVKARLTYPMGDPVAPGFVAAKVKEYEQNQRSAAKRLREAAGAAATALSEGGSGSSSGSGFAEAAAAARQIERNAAEAEQENKLAEDAMLATWTAATQGLTNEELDNIFKPKPKKRARVFGQRLYSSPAPIDISDDLNESRKG